MGCPPMDSLSGIAHPLIRGEEPSHRDCLTRALNKHLEPSWAGSHVVLLPTDKTRLMLSVGNKADIGTGNTCNVKAGRQKHISTYM